MTFLCFTLVTSDVTRPPFPRPEVSEPYAAAVSVMPCFSLLLHRITPHLSSHCRWGGQSARPPSPGLEGEPTVTGPCVLSTPRSSRLPGSVHGDTLCPDSSTPLPPRTTFQRTMPPLGVTLTRPARVKDFLLWDCSRRATGRSGELSFYSLFCYV